MKATIYTLTFLSAGLLMAQPKVDILQGTWKADGKALYEVWTKSKNGLSGYGYKIKEGKEIRTETLEIQLKDKKVIYLATVPTQNGGETIPFEQNLGEKEIISFENPEHDFPVKVQYKPISKDRMYVSVLGKDGDGYSYYIDRIN